MVARPEAEWLAQIDVHGAFLSEGKDEFLAVHRSWFQEGENGGQHVVLTNAEWREEELSKPTWDLSRYGGGFSQTTENGQTVTRYERPSETGVEPIVLDRSFHGVKPRYLEICEEFRLFHNLFQEAGSTELLKFREDGSSEVAATIQSDVVHVRTRLLRQYQAARQMDLVIYIDSVRLRSGEFVPPKDAAWIDSLANISFRGFAYDDRVGSRYLGKRVLPAPPVEKSGIWPFEVEDEKFPEFLIGHDENGDEIRFTCNPGALGNYFGLNPDAPNYMTPVHFDRSVLKKYYDNPELYTVEDGYVRCGDLWILRMDNDFADRVVVFLGDLGEYLPSRERDYWRSFNISPDKQISETGYRRAFLAEFADAQSADLRFRRAFKESIKSWRQAHGWDLFRPLEGPDAALPQQIRLPLTDSLDEFERLLLALSRTLVDSINVAELDSRLTAAVAEERSISKLERWLNQESFGSTETVIRPFRRLQRLRSATTAHRKGSDYESTLAKELGTARGRDAAIFILNELRESLAALDNW